MDRHPRMRHALLIACFALVAAHTGATASAQPAESDDYTRYELLAPETAQFRIVYEVTATTPGAAFYFNPIRKGSEATDEAVYDRMSGTPLRFEVVSPVPSGGELRLRIDKTYRDPKSYFVEGATAWCSRVRSAPAQRVLLRGPRAPWRATCPGRCLQAEAGSRSAS